MARYQDAIAWVVGNDDTEFLNDDDPMLSVTASLVADLFHKTDDEVLADIRRESIRQADVRIKRRGI